MSKLKAHFTAPCRSLRRCQSARVHRWGRMFGRTYEHFLLQRSRVLAETSLAWVRVSSPGVWNMLLHPNSFQERLAKAVVAQPDSKDGILWGCAGTSATGR